MTHDTKVKRAILIGKTVEVRDSFSFASPPSVLRALQIYCSSYYGNLAGWELEGAEAQKFYGVWRLNVVLTHNLPRGTHRYFLPMLAPGAVSARGQILSRFVKFFRGNYILHLTVHLISVNNPPLTTELVAAVIYLLYIFCIKVYILQGCQLF